MLLGISSMGGLYLVDTDNDVVEKKTDDGCYGFTFNDDYYFLTTKQRKTSDRKIMVLNKDFQVVKQITKKPEKIKHGHQMQYHKPSNKLWLTAPGEKSTWNNIYIYDLNKDECEIWTPIHDNHRLHYNSLCFKGDLLYILSHNYHVVPSFVYTYEWKTRKLVEKKGLAYGDCHNIFYIGDDFFYCASKEGKVMNVNGDVFIDTGNKGNFLRGIALNDQYIFIGNTLHKKENEKQDSDYRKLFKQSEKIYMYSIATQRIVKEIKISGTEAIHEIRILDGVDYAHTIEE